MTNRLFECGSTNTVDYVIDVGDRRDNGFGGCGCGVCGSCSVGSRCGVGCRIDAEVVRVFVRVLRPLVRSVFFFLC